MMGKTLIFVLLKFALLLITETPSDNTVGCKKYKTGSFYFHANTGHGEQYYLIKRNDTAQIEKDLATGITEKYAIKWISDCSYTLRFIDGTSQLSEDNLKFKRAMLITTNILSGTDDYYIFQSKADKANFIVSDTMWLRNKLPQTNSVTKN